MYSQIFPFTSDGNVKRLQCKFKPLAAWIIPLAAAKPAWHMDSMWCARTLPFAAGESYLSGMRFFGNDVLIGQAADINTSGNKYIAVVIGAEAGDVEDASWCGNGTALTIKLNQAKRPVAAIPVRDNANPPVLKVDGIAAANADGTSITDCVSFATGSLSVTDEAEVNEWIPATGVGEGISAPVFYGNSVKTGTWTGTGAARSLSAGVDAAMVIAWKADGTEVAYLIPRGTASFKSADANAPVSAGRLANGRLALTGTTLNATGVAYNYIAIPYREPSVAATRLPAVVTGRKALYLDGRGNTGNVDFGTGLNVAGAKTITWFGGVPGDAQSGAKFDAVLLAKCAAAQANTAGTASWGLIVTSRIDGGFKWAGPHVTGIVTNRVYYDNPIDASCWRTGILAPFGLHVHTLVIRPDGACEYWRDGVLLKQRKIQTDTFTADPTHRITMGARWSGSAYSNNSRIEFVEGSFCAGAPSDDEIRAEHARLLNNLGGQPALPGLAAWWKADNVTGTTLPDLIGLSHGTITNGLLLDL